MGIVISKDTGRACKRRLKYEPTPTERTLMVELRVLEEPYSFQYVIRTNESDVGFYIVDFYLPRRKLLVELDGAHHFSSQGHWSDRLRTEAIERARPDLLLVRFSNAEVKRDARALVEYLQSW